MKAIFTLGVCVFAGALVCNSLVAQDSPTIPSSLSNDIDAPSQQAQSLGDAARKMRKDVTTEVKMTPEDTKKLFEAVDKILAFASEDSGFPKHGTVKRQLVSREEVDQRPVQEGAILAATGPLRTHHEEVWIPSTRFQSARVPGQGQRLADCRIL
jgi:hypothetical protein